ncbi:MAG: YlcI/YnfO family protein [Enterobacteriaceae bacterium]
MATGNVNNKSAQLAARVPHDVVEGMELVKNAGESTAGFIITAMQGEITRRQLQERNKDNLVSALNHSMEALLKVKEIGEKIGSDIQSVVEVAETEIKRRKRQQVKAAK